MIIYKETEKKILTDDLQRSGKLRILLAEDMPINQFLAQTILKDFGFESDVAGNGKIAIQLLEKNHYDIILMDLMMPEMDGLEATRYIREKMQPPKSTIPIIALTADVSKEEVDKCKEAGMDDHVSKPINETDLLNKITLYIKKMGSTEEKKICNLDYLKSHSPNNPKFIAEILEMFLKQIPAYLVEINRSLFASEWSGVQGNVHKIRPSIDLVGMPKDIGILAKQIEEYCRARVHLDLIPEMVLKVEKALHQASKELEEELKNSLS